MSVVTRLALLMLLSGTLQPAGAWMFGAPVPVTVEPQAGVFQHLDSAGRRNIALSGDRIAVVWEDNRSGQPRVYLAGKQRSAAAFDPPIQISAGGEAYEPAVAGIGNGRFIVVWEEQGRVFARSAGASGLGPAVSLSAGRAAGQGTVSGWQGAGFAAWRERREGEYAIHFNRLTVDEQGVITAGVALPVEPVRVDAPQLYPSLAVGEGGVAIAWEDRRSGHTRLFFSHSKDGRQFAPPGELNEFFSNRNQYDRGSGVTRVALAAFGQDEILAAWMDKRRNGRGYSIFASLGSGGGRSYGPNERVQGDQGDELPHYNPAVAGNRSGDFIVAWDDYRSGNSDIWLSAYSDDLEWGEDFTPPPASGPGEQSNPSLALDEEGGLHLAWVEYQQPGEPTRIWYVSGSPTGR